MNAGTLTVATKGRRGVLAVSVSMLAASTAFAQQTANPRGNLEEVIVTATRREQSLQDVPLSVSAVTAESLVARGINGLADLNPGTIPGVIVGQFAGTASVLAISVRGVGLSDPTQGTTEMPVPVYIDGVFLGRAQGLGLDLIEPERVEILRGPQGQLFGRNAEGGVVQYVSRKPTGSLGVRASVSRGNYNDQRYRLSVDLPEVSGFSAQLSAIKSKHDPYTPQVQKGTYAEQADYALLDTWGARGALRWKNDSGFTADYTYDYTKGDDSQPYLTWVPVNTAASAIPGFNLRALEPQPPSTDYPSHTFGPAFNREFETRSSGHSLTLTYQTSDALTFKSISAYRKASRHGGSNLAWALPAGLPTAAGFTFPFAQEDVDQNQTSQELQFIGSWREFDLTAGAMYYNEKPTDMRTTIINGPALGTALFVPARNIQNAKTDSYGVYAQGSYTPEAVKGLELTLGLRYTDDKKTAKRTYAFAVNDPINRPGQLATPLVANFKASRVDPAVVIKYTWTEGLNTYFRYATGYRAGGANVRSSNFTSFGEEVNKAWELGMKSLLLNNRVGLNVALFYNIIKHEQLTVQEAPTTDPSLTNTFNSPIDKKVKGVEAELTWNVFEGLNVGLNFAYMDVKKIRETDNPYTPAVDLTRFYTVQVPKTSGSVSVDYQTRPLPVGRLAFHTD